jgi:putative effector of murein hydrolase LrgA (UPF0299 family)
MNITYVAYVILIPLASCDKGNTSFQLDGVTLFFVPVTIKVLTGLRVALDLDSNQSLFLHEKK